LAQAKLTIEQLQEALDAFIFHGSQAAAADALNIPAATFGHRLKAAQRRGVTPNKPMPVAEPDTVDITEAVRHALLRHPMSMADMQTAFKADAGQVLDAVDAIKADGANLVREGDRWSIAKTFAQGWTDGSQVIEIMSRPDNTFLFGACGDQHVGSKYHREDVSRDLYRRYSENGVQAAFNTGNWIDGEARFNTYDILAHGLDAQARLLAEIHPHADFPTYAVWGDDHEGWYAQREGINVGSYVEGIMRTAGHDWHDLGFMEAHVRLVNANSGKSALLAVVHPGGGSSYANSYRPQKIIESFEGGEKPAVLLLGHYHKLDPGLTRNVWYLQTGTCQDQTPFMRKKSLEAHVGGAMIHLEQDPATGAITGFTPSLWRYFNRGYYVTEGKANNRWSKHGKVNQIPRGSQT
jgi:hypothetical protein